MGVIAVGDAIGDSVLVELTDDLRTNFGPNEPLLLDVGEPSLDNASCGGRVKHDLHNSTCIHTSESLLRIR
jgi:hypothetical protein